MILLLVELHLGLGHRSRFVFGSFGWKFTEETQPKTEDKTLWMIHSLQEIQFSGVIGQLFFSNSHPTFVKGTKDSNQSLFKSIGK